jgi:multicomponent Na+:H+ antiporter subunit B
MVVFGTNVIIHGDLTPGGGFQGGAIVATFLSFLLVAYGGKRLLSWVNERFYTSLVGFGLLLFLGLAFMGLPTSFFYNFASVTHQAALAGGAHGIIPPSGTIALMDIAVGIEVTGGLSLIVIYMFKGIRLYETSPSGTECGHDR